MESLVNLEKVDTDSRNPGGNTNVAKCRWICKETGCGKIFQYKKSLNNHRRQCHIEDEQLKCSHCEKRFSSKANLAVHERIHNGEMPLRCQVSGCNIIFRTAHFLKEHVKNVHSSSDSDKDPTQSTFECPYCDQILSNERNQRLHIQRHFVKSLILCSICNREFFCAKSHERHMQSIHSGKNAKFNEQRLNSNKCRFCDKRFFTKREVRDHCLLSHKNFRGLPCPVCKKYFISVTALHGHVKNHGDLEEAKAKHKCAQCGASFTTSSHYKEHRRRHEKTFSHKCPVCPAGFFRQGKLDVHLNRFHRPTIETRCIRTLQREAAKHRESILSSVTGVSTKCKQGRPSNEERKLLTEKILPQKVVPVATVVSGEKEPVKTKNSPPRNNFNVASTNPGKIPPVTVPPEVNLSMEIEINNNNRIGNKENMNRKKEDPQKSNNSNRSEFSNTFLQVSSFPSFNWSLLKPKSEKVLFKDKVPVLKSERKITKVPSASPVSSSPVKMEMDLNLGCCILFEKLDENQNQKQ